MVTMSLSVVSFTGFVIEPMIVEGNATRYVPPQVGKILEADLVQFLHELRIQTSLRGSKMRKCSGSRKSKIVLALLRKNDEATVGIRVPKNIP